MPYVNDDSEAERAAAYAARKAAIANAWRQEPEHLLPPSAHVPPAASPPPELACATAKEAHEDMVRRLTNAWRPDGRR